MDLHLHGICFVLKNSLDPITTVNAHFLVLDSVKTLYLILSSNIESIKTVQAKPLTRCNVYRYMAYIKEIQVNNLASKFLTIDCTDNEVVFIVPSIHVYLQATHA
jgi:hypothetical protein